MGLFDFLKKNGSKEKNLSEETATNSKDFSENSKISHENEPENTLENVSDNVQGDVNESDRESFQENHKGNPEINADKESVSENCTSLDSDSAPISQNPTFEDNTEFSEQNSQNNVKAIEEKQGFFERLKNGLKRTKDSVFGQINSIFSNFVKVDEDMLEELEEVLIASDVGINITQEIIEELRSKIKENRITDPEDAKKELISILISTIGEDEPLKTETTPSVILVVGVNGVGKTTSIAKLANMLKAEGKSVVLAAADTFRAAAIDQLEIWADRVGVPIVKHSEGADPAAVVFDACSYVKSHKADVLIVDTAGRLHIKKNLMDELAKISRVIDRELPGASRETLLILDAVTGQNAINQAKEFMHTSDITGIILTKLDGTAKGGVVISVKKELGIPVKFIGVGEQMDDLQKFSRDDFVKALFED